MALLKPAKKELAFAKVGMLGFAKSGKTFTSTQIAIGLAKLIKTKKPIGFLDTETGSDFMIPLFEREGLELVVAKTRAFKDLLAITREAEQSCDILLIDSVSHIWNDLLGSYMKKKNKTRLDFQDWAVIKPTWAEFTDLFLTSKLHIIFAARAAFEWDYFKDEETGKMELHKTGTKMRAESEFGFEPSLLIEMERIKNGREFTHRAWVLGDRSQLLDGQHFDNPTFDTFLPHFQYLALGGEHMPLDTTRDSQDMFDHNGKPEWRKQQIQKQIDLEEIQAFLVELWPSTSSADKKAKADMLEIMFGSRAWKYAEEEVYPSILRSKKEQLDIFRKNYSIWSDEESDLAKLWEKAGEIYDLRAEEEPQQTELGV